MGVWLTYDGTRAFVTGNYTTPQSGEYQGQLGPWSGLVESVGLDPRGTVMKTVHVGLGLRWLLSAGLLLMGRPTAWRTALVSGVLSLWYLPFGTVAGLAMVAIEVVRRRRG